MSQQYDKQAVANLQRYLRQLSYHDSRISPVPIDGIYGEKTRDSLLKFQQLNDLDPTGIADAITWEALYAEYLSSLADTSRSLPVYIFPDYPSGYSLEIGDSWFLVSIVQYILSEIDTLYGDTYTRITGIYDNETYEAVKRFQKKNFLPETGKTDLATWNRLSESFNHYQSDPKQ